MIWSALLAARAFLSRVPWQAWVVLAVLLTGWLWGNHRYSQGELAERTRWQAAAAKAVAKDGKADVAAIETAAEQKAEAQTEITAAREAAKDAPDPWQAAVEAMR